MENISVILINNVVSRLKKKPNSVSKYFLDQSILKSVILILRIYLEKRKENTRR